MAEIYFEFVVFTSLQAFHKWLLQIWFKMQLSSWMANHTLIPNMSVLSERWMLVWWALQVSFPLPPCLLFKKIHHLIPYIFSLLGFSMFFSLKLAQLLQEEGLQYLRSPPPVWLTRHLIGEGQNLQFCKLRWHLNKSAADQSWQLIPQTLNATLGTCQRISLRSSQKVLHDFVDGTERRSWSN